MMGKQERGNNGSNTTDMGRRGFLGAAASLATGAILVASLTSTEALRKTLELVATRGPAQHDLDAVFAQLDADPPGAVDAVLDLPNRPPLEEPERVRRDMAAVSSDPRNP